MQTIKTRIKPANNPLSAAEYPIFLNAKKAAELLVCTERFLYHLVGNEKGPPCYRMGRRLRWKSADLINWLEQNRVR